MTDRYAVIGYPIEHSRSPQIHAAFARQTGQDMAYGRILGDPKKVEPDIRHFFAAGGKGLNVTVPFKEAAWRIAEEKSAQAASAGAVNTLILLPNNRLRGDNTDGTGLVRDLVHNHGFVVSGARILLLGAGGASRGVVRPLLDKGPEMLVIGNRTAAKAVELANSVKHLGAVEGCGLDALIGRQFDLIINGTAASLSGQIPTIADNALTRGGWTYDMMYADKPTSFCRWGQAHGAAKALDGLGMLVEQAAESFYLWRGVRPQTGPVIAVLRENS